MSFNQDMLVHKDICVMPTTETEDCSTVVIENNKAQPIESVFSCEQKVSLETKQGYDSICDAIRDCNSDILKNLLTRNVDVNVRNNEGYTPIFEAIRSNDSRIVTLFLNNGANVNVKTAKGYAPIHEAVEVGNIEVINILLNKGVDINVRTNDDNPGDSYIFYSNDYVKTERGVTPVYNAVCNGNIEIVELLLDKGALVNAKTTEGCTPLFEAIRRGDKVLAQILINNGANVNTGTKENENAKINKTQESDPPLYLAVHYEDEDIVKILLNNHADVNAKSKEGITILYEAVRAGHKEIVELLVRNGADINIDTEEGDNPLYCAVWNEYEEIVKVLLDNGANVNAKSEEDFTPIYEAIRTGNKNVIEMLLNYGADIGSQEREIPVFWYENEEIVTILLDNGAKVNAIDRYNNTMIDTALYDVVSKHMIKLKCAKLDTGERDWVNYKFDALSFEQNCRQEIIELKSEIINNNISLYDILTTGISSLIPYVQYNCSMVDLKSKNFSINYPIYGGILNSRFHNLKRKELSEYAILFFDYIMKDLPLLPYVCRKNILQFLRNHDLRKLIKFVKEDDRVKNNKSE